MRRAFRFSFLLFLLPLVCVGQRSRTPDVNTDPANAARAFYSWYLHNLIAEVDPLTQRTAEMKRSVSRRLLAEIAQEKKSGNYDADYFLQAQDWNKEWEGNISVSKSDVRPDRATLRVDLTGGQADFSRHLRVALVIEEGIWKIDKVAELK